MRGMYQWVHAISQCLLWQTGKNLSSHNSCTYWLSAALGVLWIPDWSMCIFLMATFNGMHLQQQPLTGKRGWQLSLHHYLVPPLSSLINTFVCLLSCLYSLSITFKQCVCFWWKHSQNNHVFVQTSCLRPLNDVLGQRWLPLQPPFLCQIQISRLLSALVDI